MSLDDMDICIVSNGSCSAGEGLPDYFVSDDDFEKILSDSGIAAEIYRFVGRNVCIARLGKKGNDGIYRDYKPSCSGLDTEKSKEGVNYYEEVSETL